MLTKNSSTRTRLPSASPNSAGYKEGTSVTEMIKEDLIAERIAIESYREFAEYLGNDDPVTRRMIEDILATEEEHADDLAGLISRMDGT